jgi:hypothetical protein
LAGQSARLRKWVETGERLWSARPAARRSGFHSNEKLVPFDVIAGRGWSPTRKGLIQQLEVEVLVGFHEEPVGKGTAAGAGHLIAEQLN